MYSGGGSWGGSSLFKNLRFIGWDSDVNDCGAEQSAIGTDWDHPDYHPIAHFEDILFKDTDESAMFKFDSPKQGWANPTDCGDFTCTGLY